MPAYSPFSVTFLFWKARGLFLIWVAIYAVSTSQIHLFMLESIFSSTSGFSWRCWFAPNRRMLDLWQFVVVNQWSRNGAFSISSISDWSFALVIIAIEILKLRLCVNQLSLALIQLPKIVTLKFMIYLSGVHFFVHLVAKRVKFGQILNFLRWLVKD